MAGGVRKAVDERFYLSSAKGGGMLRREIWVDRRGRVVRYNLAYVNHLVHAGDDGRVGESLLAWPKPRLAWRMVTPMTSPFS